MLPVPLPSCRYKGCVWISLADCKQQKRDAFLLACNDIEENDIEENDREEIDIEENYIEENDIEEII